MLALLAPAPLLAQSLRDMIASTPEGRSLNLPAGETLGRADIVGNLTLSGGGPDSTVLRAPGSDAILIVTEGSSLTAQGLRIRQDGSARFGIYVDGGALTLADCAFDGAFESAIYLRAGTLTISDCSFEGGLDAISSTEGGTLTLERVTITGDGDFGVLVDGGTATLAAVKIDGRGRSAVQAQNGAALDLMDVTVTGAGGDGVILIDPGALRAERISFAGTGGAALYVQGAASANLSAVVVEPGWLAGFSASGGGSLDLKGFALSGAEQALTVQGYSGPTSIAQGRASVTTADGVAAVLSGNADLTLSDVTLLGGLNGLQLTGTTISADLLGLRATDQTGTGLYLADNQGRVVIDAARVISSGETIPLYLQGGVPVTIRNGAFLAQGAYAFAGQEAPPADLSGNMFVAAPAEPGLLWPIATAEGARPVFLPLGAVNPFAGDIAPGSERLMSHVDLAETPGLDQDLKAAVAAFALKEPADMRALALALDLAWLALPQADPAAETMPLGLAPPEPGWIWSDNAIAITLTSTNGLDTQVLPQDFPLDLVPGVYRVTADGRDAGFVTVDGQSELTLPLPEAPFFAWRSDEGGKVRGEALYLRPAADLAALLAGMRPLYPGEYWGGYSPPVPRAGADRATAAAALAAARSDIPALLDQMVTLQQAEQWPAFNRLWQRVDIALDLFGAFGTGEDAAWLLSLAPPDITFDNLETAALIEARLGLLEGGAVEAEARRRMADLENAGPEDQQVTLRLVTALARLESRVGLALLAEAYDVMARQSPAHAPFDRAVVELSRAGPEIAGSVPSDYLDRLEVAVDMALAGDLPEDARPSASNSFWIAAAAALAAEARDGLPPRSLPVIMPFTAGEFAFVLEDPARAFAGRLGGHGPTFPNPITSWTYDNGRFLCPALALRSPAEREAIVGRTRAVMQDAVFSAILANNPEGGGEDPLVQFQQIALAFDFTAADCLLTMAVLNHYGRDAAGEEAAFFDKLDYEPYWWARLPRAKAAMAHFASGGDFPVFAGLSPYPTEALLDAVGPDSKGDPDLLDAVVLRHRLTNDGFQAPMSLFTFGAERRQFRLRNEGGNGSVTIAGYVEVRPLVDGDRLIIAIRHNISSPDFGGLAAMITEPDRAPWEADNRRLMFDSLTLDTGGREVAVTHEATGADGVHYFTAPFSGTLDDTVLHLGMRYWDATWNIDIALWNTMLGRALRQEAAP
ncbi:MAG: hypothetical protein C0524_18035 [Rhodobacter sp.]|nr:hypothetical protein [Rhodobacter sp.]